MSRKAPGWERSRPREAGRTSDGRRISSRCPFRLRWTGPRNHVFRFSYFPPRSVRLIHDDLTADVFKLERHIQKILKPLADFGMQPGFGENQKEPSPACAQKLSAQSPGGPRGRIDVVDHRGGNLVRQGPLQFPVFVQEGPE